MSASDLKHRRENSKIDADLRADHKGVGNLPGAARGDDVLGVGLDEISSVAETENIRPLNRRLLLLDPDRRMSTAVLAARRRAGRC